jgi:hypothetical protein
MSKPAKHKTLADMSLPAEERARGRKSFRAIWDIDNPGWQ